MVGWREGRRRFLGFVTEPGSRISELINPPRCHITTDKLTNAPLPRRQLPALVDSQQG